MPHVTRETHDMCRQGVKTAKRGRSISPNAVKQHNFACLWPWHNCQKNERHRSREDPVKYASVEDVAFAGCLVAIHSIRNVSRSETISVSLDVLETFHECFPKDPSSLGTLGEGYINPSGCSAAHPEGTMINIWGLGRRSCTQATGRGRDSTGNNFDSSPSAAPRIWGRAGVAT